MVDKLISKLRYMGKQYATGMESRGGGLHKHYLEEAADELESLRAEVETLRRERDEWHHEFKAAYKRETELQQELAALRKRIDDAHVHDKRFRMTFSGVQEISLICREDLK